MSKTTEPFIKLGWHTVTLGGELKRLPNGKKTIPIFSKDWREQCRLHRVTDPGKLGGVLTGRESNIIAIDCDNTATYEMFKALDPDYKFHFISKGKKDIEGKEQESGTIIYEYTDKLPDTFRIHNSVMSIDFLSNNGMTYLPTEANETKHPMVDIPDIKPMPDPILALCVTLYASTQAPKNVTVSQKNHRLNLAPQVEHFMQTKQVTKSLFRILTPKDFRDLDEYRKKGYLHPNDVEDGRGSEYLSKVSAILGADASISIDLYNDAMAAINNLFDDPMPRARLNSTIIGPMIEGGATVDGHPIWQEDEDWDKDTLYLRTKAQDIIHIFYDADRLSYYVVDIGQEKVHQFDQPSALANHIASTAIEPMSKNDLQREMPLALAGAVPQRAFGFYDIEETNAKYFNTFISTTPYKIFKNPEEYALDYKPPEITLKYLETLVPDEKMREYLLGFLRRKLDTFEYSPVILYFLGVAGSGKDTFVKMLERIIGEDSIERPTAKVFLEKHNGWIVDKFFVQLDEYGDQLTNMKQKEEALGLLKAFTGKPRIQIRKMHTDGFAYEHKITFVMTANRNPLMLDADDRRVALFDCPNFLPDADWIYDAGGMATVIERLEEETNDFCYYLATEVKSIDAKAYNTPPKSKNKEELITRSMADNKRIAYFLKTQNWLELKKLIMVYGGEYMLERASKNRFMEHHLVELYENLRDNGEDGKLAVRAAMHEMGFDKQRSSAATSGSTALVYYYYIPGLSAIRNVVLEIEDDS